MYLNSSFHFDLVPGKVRDLNSTTITKDTIKLIWRCPKVVNGIIHKYVIVYKNSKQREESKNVNDTGSQMMYTAESLKNYVEYSFKA